MRERPVDEVWKQLSAELNVEPILARILTSRGIRSASDLDYSLHHLIPVDRLAGVETAANRLVSAIERQERIIITGDFDTDGATASVLCVSALQTFGARNVDFAVPNRIDLGYGLSKKFVESLIPLEPDLIITVDNGISSIDGVNFAQENGIDVIITDHHLPPKSLPPAVAIVNPQLQNGEFGSHPAGVGVAFYLILKVRRSLQESGYFEKHGISAPNLASYLDLVALGTVADLVPLDRNNRLLVSQGLRRMQNGRTRPGIESLCKLSGVDIKKIDEEKIGFQISPRLNAAGRLQDMKIGIHALLADDRGTAMKYATELQQINLKRRELQREMTDVALHRLHEYIDENRCSVCIYDQRFHEGIVGLVASKLAHTTKKPAIVFASGKKDVKTLLLKGSARSIPGIHIRDVLADMATAYPHLIQSYGGHAMAAGLAIHRDSLERFTNIFDGFVAERVTENTFTDVIYTDGELEDHHFSLDFVNEIDSYGPWGQAYPKPLFHGTFEVLLQQFTTDGKHLKLELAYKNRLLDAIVFHRSERVSQHVSIAYRLAVNDYRARPTLQLVVEHVESVSD